MDVWKGASFIHGNNDLQYLLEKSEQNDTRIPTTPIHDDSGAYVPKTESFCLINNCLV